MPVYEYRCRSCGHQFEVQQSFSDDPLTTCEDCGGELRKVFAPVGITFKGSGFYKTDSRSGSSGKGSGSATSGSSETSSSGSSSGSTSSDSSGSSSSSGSSGSSTAATSSTSSSSSD